MNSISGITPFLQVKDQLARISGVGDVVVFGARDYSMRIWLDPEKLASRNLTASDVVRAVREQNLQVAAGTIGQPPVPSGQDFQLNDQHTRTAVGRTAVQRHHHQARGRKARSRARSATWPESNWPRVTTPVSSQLSGKPRRRRS